MDSEKQEQLESWFEEFEGWEDTNKFEDLGNKLHESQQISAILFLYSKLKAKRKPQIWFLHGEHDELYIGQDFDIFEDFTEEDVKLAITLGIYLLGDGDGFQIYASM